MLVDDINVKCNICGKPVPVDDDNMPQIINPETSKPICEYCFEKNFFSCDGCEGIYSSDSCNECPNGALYCDDCIGEHMDKFEEY